VAQVSANVKDSSSSANIPVDGVSVAAAGAAITGGQALRNCFVLGKSDGTANWADPDGAGNLQVNLKTAIPAGANTIGAVTAHTVSARVTVNNAHSTSQYTTVGWSVGGLWTFANAFGAATTGVLQSISIAIKSTQTATFTMYIFSAAPTAPTDHQAYAISAADAANILGHYDLTNPDSKLGANSTSYNLDGIGMQLDSSTTSLYAILLLASGTPTFSASPTIYVSVGVLQD
jgi:hypothetical protein